ncbi:hypothetical protein G9464_02985 [Halostella sp. JP-L12]|uniref:hypothetical protein n=1 Tax=Halostella TaxID=1843185 RepID=UPI0013CF07E0|nr:MULTISPECIES: hypothetical protein [Halostella]NHN46563.1 hypothetical protein [Halostella sp. JP-L12]
MRQQYPLEKGRDDLRPDNSDENDTDGEDVRRCKRDTDRSPDPVGCLKRGIGERDGTHRDAADDRELGETDEPSLRRCRPTRTTASPSKPSSSRIAAGCLWPTGRSCST